MGNVQSKKRKSQSYHAGDRRQRRLADWHRQKFFSAASKSPSVYTVAPICKVLGVSLDGYFGIGDHLTADEKTLRERADGLEHRLENKRRTIGLMKDELRDLRHSVKLYRWIILGLSLLIVGLIVWCIWGDIHCADYGIWRG